MDNLLTKEEDFVFQGAGKPKVGPKKPISLVILTTKLESKKNTLAPPVKKMMEKSSSLGLKKAKQEASLLEIKEATKSMRLILKIRQFLLEDHQ